jgi:DNA invertase Pin-like site-specific DNA recombinase
VTSTERDLLPVVDYARASTDKNKDEHSVEDQQRLNERTAKRLGLRIVARFKDNDKSAAKADLIREDFERMLKVLKDGRLPDGTLVRGCLVDVEDRLVRKAGDYERVVDAITFEDGRVFADRHGFKDLYDVNVEVMGLMGAVLSRTEVKKMRRRVRRWHRSRAEQGKAPAGHRPFGWQDDRQTLDLAESALMSKAIRKFIGGRSVNSIIREWQHKGVKTPRGNEWTAGAFRNALKNARLCGWRMIDKEIVRDEDGDPVVGDWDPIITPDEWQAVQAILRARARKTAETTDNAAVLVHQDEREHTYLLAGFLRCGRILDDGTMCGTKMRAQPLKQPDGRYVYRCRSKADGGCNGVTRNGPKVDVFISEAVLAKLEREAQVRSRNLGPWLRKRELEEKEGQLRELRKRFAARKISNTLFFGEVERLEPEIAELRKDRERHALAAQQANTDISDIRRRWYSEDDEDRLDTSQKRAYIRAALHAVIVHPAGRGYGKTFNPDLLEPIWREA